MRVCLTCHSLFSGDLPFCPKDNQPTVDHSAALIGSQLGPYVVKREINEGGMGIVYEAEHPTLGRRVALKILRPELSLRDDIVERFVQEARAVNTIGHKNIVNVYDFGKTPFGSFYFVMEYLDGSTLRSMIERDGPQSLELVRYVVREAGQALSAAHKKGFIHRDVKPENLMITRRQNSRYMKLLDFGIAKLRSGQTTEHSEIGGVGTPQYMSPEQLDDTMVDPRTDVYALGVVVYELLTGRVPYMGNSPAQVRQRQLTQKFVTPSLFRSDIAQVPDVDDTIRRAVALDPNQRFATIDEFVAAFEEACAELILAHTQTEMSSARRRNYAPYFMFATAVVLGGLVVGLFTYTRRRADDAEAPQVKIITATPPNAVEPPPGNIPLPEQARALVVSQLRSKVSMERQQILQSFREIPAVVPAFKLDVLRLLDDADPRVKKEAAWALGGLNVKDPQVIATLSQALKRNMSFTALDIAIQLGRLGEAEGTRFLQNELNSPRAKQPFYAKAVLEGLAVVGDKAGLALRPHAERTPWTNADAKVRMLGALSQLGDAKSKEDLIAGLKDQGWAVRLASAQQMLSWPGDQGQKARATLQAALRSAPPLEQAIAANSLVGSGDTQSRNILLKLLRSKDLTVERRCALALVREKWNSRDMAWTSTIGEELVKTFREGANSVKLVAALGLI